jgi:hypothetical protein
MPLVEQELYFLVGFYVAQSLVFSVVFCGDRLKIPKKKSEGQPTQWPNGQIAVYKTIHGKQNIEQRETHKEIGGELIFSGMVSGSCYTCGTYSVTLVTNLVISHE